MAKADRTRGKKKKRKRKVATSRRPAPRGAAANTPVVPHVASIDVTNQVVTQRHRAQADGTMRAQQPMSPSFPGNIPTPQGAAGSARGAGAAAGVGASIAAAAGSAPGVGAAAALAGESSLAANATVITAYDQMLARLTDLEATVAQLQPPQPTPGTGHNYPPPDTAELEEIKRDIALLKAKPPPSPVEANNIAVTAHPSASV